MGENIIEIAGLRKSFDHVEVVKGVDMQVHQGEFLTLLGPSGCGKTTTLRMIAGFEEADSGHITIDGQEVTALPPYKRAVNTVFQSYALFPLMNVYDNVAYGLTVKRLPKAEIREKVTQALRTVQLEGFEKRRVSQMSGGQCQRVAIARALVNGPKVLLLDEPLGALDLKLRKQMQLELKRLQKQLGITFIYVTHDQEEAMTMSDRIAVMCAGEIQQIGTPSEIYNAPATRFVADFIGESNILPATAAAVRGDTCVYTTPMGQVLGAAAHVSEGETVYLCVRPEAVCVSAEPVSDFGIQITVTDNICTGNLIKSIGVDADGHELRFSRLAARTASPAERRCTPTGTAPPARSCGSRRRHEEKRKETGRAGQRRALRRRDAASGGASAAVCVPDEHHDAAVLWRRGVHGILQRIQGPV